MAIALPSHAQLRAGVPTHRPPALARIESSAELPTEFGTFRIHVFSNDLDSLEHLALVRGDVAGARDVPARMHSECLTGDALGSLRCDCRAQLQRALDQLGKEERGVLLYLRQEGRGIGLTNKIRAYRLQELGYDTIDANLALGFAADERDYSVAAAMLRTLGIESVALMTNNPDKIEKLCAAGIVVSERRAHEIDANVHNRAYLETKAVRSGHLLQHFGKSVATARGSCEESGSGG
jgi:GTP cyclohydrolase II